MTRKMEENFLKKEGPHKKKNPTGQTSGNSQLK
jgi:hypothetical protein